ncbi:MAG: hypothetical protein ACRDTA_00560, partial [Pseudonocardiaceae bacterium]
MLVAATKTEAEHHAGMLSDDEVVELKAQVEPAPGRPASVFVEVAIGGIEQQRIVRGIELDVLAAQPHQLVDLLAQDLGDVG